MHYCVSRRYCGFCCDFHHVCVKDGITLNSAVNGTGEETSGKFMLSLLMPLAEFVLETDHLSETNLGRNQ